MGGPCRDYWRKHARLADPMHEVGMSVKFGRGRRMTQGPEANAAVRPVPGRGQHGRGWLLLVALLVVEYALFRQFALREVAWAVPLSYDQTAYLAQSYAAYEQIKDRGLLTGLGGSLAGGAESGILVP